MTGAGRYAELAAAVRSFKAELIRPNQIQRLMESTSLSEIAGTLTNGYVTLGEGADTNEIERYLVNKVIELARRLAAYAPHDSRILITLFSTKYELDCAKVILRSIADEIDPDDALRHMVPAGKFTQELCKELVEGRNPLRVVENIEDEALSSSLATRVTRGNAADQGVLAIDQYYYQKLWSASNLPDPLDAQSAKGLVGEMIDHLNILLALRARLIGLDARAVSELLIPINYALGQSYDELPETTNIQNLTRVLERTPYGKVLQGRTLGSLANIELALNQSHATSCFNAFAGLPFNVGLALALLFLKNYELQDLFAVINGKTTLVSSDLLLNSLILRSPEAEKAL
jgi:vacuolar-type H+-ATPase subunit C/Vma6